MDLGKLGFTGVEMEYCLLAILLSLELLATNDFWCDNFACYK